MNELISIIVPVYNAEKTLERCVHSLSRQEYRNIEILLVNDGSRDGSLALCRELAAGDGRITVIDKPNGGVSSARNVGLNAAAGEYVMFCDSDDWVSPQWCAAMMENCLPEGLTICNYATFDGEKVHSSESGGVQYRNRKLFFHQQMLMCSPWNKIFSRRVIVENGLSFSPKLRLGEDFCFVMDYLCAIPGDLCYVGKSLYYYDITTADSLVKKTPQLEQTEMLYQHMCAAMEQLGATDEETIQVRNLLFTEHYEGIFRSLAMNREKNFRQKRKEIALIKSKASYGCCVSSPPPWENKLLQWFYRNGWSGMILAYYWLRARKRQVNQ